MFERLLSDAGVDFSANEKKEEKIAFKPIKIVVIGAGGAGNNTVTRLYNMGIETAHLVAVNTDMQQLESEETKAHEKILIGTSITRGLGAGGDPKKAYMAAEEDLPKIMKVVSDADLVFITAGMGGGTGTGSAPVIARAIKEAAVKNGKRDPPLIVAVVTYPFAFEGGIKQQKAKKGIQALAKYADTVIVIDNNKLLELVPQLPLDQAFKVSDELIAQIIKGLSDTINKPSLVNIDYADVYTVMKSGGIAMIGVGESNSKNKKATDAVLAALNNKLLDVEYLGGKAALVHFTVGPDTSIKEINDAMQEIRKRLKQNSEIIWGARIEKDMEGYVRAMVIMTGVTTPLLKEISQNIEKKPQIPRMFANNTFISTKQIDEEILTDFYKTEEEKELEEKMLDGIELI